MHNFFDIFDLEVRYDLAKPTIESKYFELLGKYHPDKAQSDQERVKCSQLSSIINNGYKVLLDDFKRAAHILELNNININDDEKSPKLPLDILAEILEMQETLEANPDSRTQILDNAKIQKEHLINELSELFEAEDYKEASIKAMHLKYLSKI
jgi:molecular chaperone HscB